MTNQTLFLESLQFLDTFWKDNFSLEKLFFLFVATPAVYGSPQVRGQIRPAAAGLHHGHSNARSELHLWLTPQLRATPDSSATEWGQGSNLHPHGDYNGSLTSWATAGTPMEKHFDLLRRKQLGWSIKPLKKCSDEENNKKGERYWFGNSSSFLEILSKGSNHWHGVVYYIL